MYLLEKRIKFCKLLNERMKQAINDEIHVHTTVKTNGKFSDIYICELHDKTKSFYFCVKLIPLKTNSKKFMYDTRFGIWREIKSLIWATKIVKSCITQNLPIMYDHYIIRNFGYLNPNIDTHKYPKEKVKQYNLLVINELSTMDLKTWVTIRFNTNIDTSSAEYNIWHTYKLLKNNALYYSNVDTKKESELIKRIDEMYDTYGEIINYIDKNIKYDGHHDFKEWMNCYFQIFSGLYVIQTHMKMFHDDLHWSNILISTSNSQINEGYWKYIVNGITYYIPNMGFVCKLWDFGLAHSDFFIGSDKWEDDIDPNKRKMLETVNYDSDTNEMYKEIYTRDVKRICNIATWCRTNKKTKERYGKTFAMPSKRFLTILQQISNDKKATPARMLEKYFSIYRHEKIGAFIPKDKTIAIEEMIPQSISKNIKTYDDLLEYKKIFLKGEHVLYKRADGFIICEINSTSMSDDKIEILLDHHNTIKNVSVRNLIRFGFRLKSKFDDLCIATFNNDMKIDLTSTTEIASSSSMSDGYLKSIETDPVTNAIYRYVNTVKSTSSVKKNI